MTRVGKAKVDVGDKRVSILVKAISSRKYGIIVWFDYLKYFSEFQQNTPLSIVITLTFFFRGNIFIEI